MPVIRFVREGRDVPCAPGENLREVALREGLELYGWKGRLGNCGGCGQCITCFVAIEDGDDGPPDPQALSPRTPVEEVKLRRRPENWRLACQTMVQRSVLVLTRPQSALADRRERLEAARRSPLPEGPGADGVEPPEGSATGDEAPIEPKSNGDTVA
jgi:ferredoxin